MASSTSSTEVTMAILISWLIIGAILISYRAVNYKEFYNNSILDWMLIVTSGLIGGPLMYLLINFNEDVDSFKVSVYDGDEDV